MSFPFYQGNVQDLLDIAGAGQGSFVLGQLQHQQMKDLENKALMAEIERRYKEQEMRMNEQKMRQQAELHPYNVQKMGADISSSIVNREGQDIQNQQAQGNLEAWRGAGGPQGAAQALQTTRGQADIKLTQERWEQMIDELSQLSPYQGGGPSGKGFIYDAAEIAKKYLGENHPMMGSILSATQNPQAWQQFQQRLFEASRRGRELKFQQEQQTLRTRETAQAAKERAIEVAKIRAAQAEAAARAKNYQAAVIQMEQAAEEAMQAGDAETANKFKARANTFAALDQAARGAGAGARREGTPDISGMTGGQVPTHPAPTPTLPYPPQQSPAPQQQDPNLGRLPQGSKANGNGTYTLPDGRIVRPKQ